MTARFPFFVHVVPIADRDRKDRFRGHVCINSSAIYILPNPRGVSPTPHQSRWNFAYSRLTLLGDVRLLVPSSIACIFLAPSLFYKPMITLARMHISSFTTSESRTGSRYLIPGPRPYEFTCHLHSIESARCISYPSSESVEFFSVTR